MNPRSDNLSPMSQHITFKWSSLNKAYTTRLRGKKFAIPCRLFKALFPDVRFGRDYVASAQAVTEVSDKLNAQMAASC